MDEEPPFPTELEGLGSSGRDGDNRRRRHAPPTHPELNAQGVPTSQTIVEVSAAGEVNELICSMIRVMAFLQLCASPSEVLQWC